MPLRKECSIAAMESNIATEVRAGRPQPQAVAIAQSTLRAACKAAGKPVPTRKAARVRTMEFLEGAFERARVALNPRDFAMIFQAARASAGGKVAAKRRRERYEASVAEKLLMEKSGLVKLNGQEFELAAASLNKAYSSKKRKGEPLDGILSKARSFMSEAKKRGTKLEGPAYTEPTEKAYAGYMAVVPPGSWDSNSSISISATSDFDNTPPKVDLTHLQPGLTSGFKETETKKGFVNTQPEGGMHAHGLDRRNSKTLNDGGHLHMWRLPGTGELFISVEDGWHQHVLGGGANTAKDGVHSHRVLLPSGESLETKLGGAHLHQLMVETSGFDGLHQHVLVMPDGTEVSSLTVEQFVESLEDVPLSLPLMSASAIAGALHELMEAEAEEELFELPDLDEAVEMVLMNKSIPSVPFALECIDFDDSYAYLQDADGREYKAETSIAGKALMRGDIVDVQDRDILGFSKSVVPDSAARIDHLLLHTELIRKHTAQVPFIGPQDADLLFICTAPNELEVARKEAMVGENALTFAETYLKPLGLTKKNIAIGFAMPVLPVGEMNTEACEQWKPHLVEALKTYSNAKVVALGKFAREVLADGGVDYWSLPHPSAVRKKGDSGEVKRKLKAISKALDVKPTEMQNSSHRPSPSSKDGATGELTDAISEMRKTGHATCRVIKSASEKQIVYGVVLDPYDVDLQNEWVPPGEIESTAHGFLKKSRVIGFEHARKADAQIVESWVEPYPSTADYQAALENRPHKAYVRKFGLDDIHSGAWVAGVQVGDDEWALYQQEKLNAFSVGGFSFKTKVMKTAMPEVEFIRLIEAPA